MSAPASCTHRSKKHGLMSLNCLIGSARFAAHGGARCSGILKQLQKVSALSRGGPDRMPEGGVVTPFIVRFDDLVASDAAQSGHAWSERCEPEPCHVHHRLHFQEAVH